MDELDDEQHMPEGVESAVWQRLVQARRQKVESEQQVNAMFDSEIVLLIHRFYKEQQENHLCGVTPQTLECLLSRVDPVNWGCISSGRPAPRPCTR